MPKVPAFTRCCHARQQTEDAQMLKDTYPMGRSYGSAHYGRSSRRTMSPKTGKKSGFSNENFPTGKFGS
jgi:hypothetical protein